MAVEPGSEGGGGGRTGPRLQLAGTIGGDLKVGGSSRQGRPSIVVPIHKSHEKSRHIHIYDGV